MDRIPNLVDVLFIGGTRGTGLYQWFLQCMVLFLAIYNAVLLAVVIAPGDWDTATLVFFVLSLPPPILSLWYLVPHTVEKLCCVTSVEYMKDKECVEEVIEERRREQIHETLQMLRLVKLSGRVRGSETLTAKEREEALKAYDKLNTQTKTKINSVFKIFDEDSSNSIDAKEMEQVLMSIGLEDQVGELAEKFVKLVDDDQSGELSLEEFQMMMSMALVPRSDEEDKADTRAAFALFDKDGSGEVDVTEVEEVMHSLGTAVSGAFIEATLFECFKRMKTTLDADDFVQWVQFLDTKFG